MSKEYGAVPFSIKNYFRAIGDSAAPAIIPPRDWPKIATFEIGGFAKLKRDGTFVKLRNDVVFESLGVGLGDPIIVYTPPIRSANEEQ